MLVLKEKSDESDHKPSQFFPLPPGVHTCVKDKKCESMLKSSRSITQTTLPILNKMANSNTVDVSISATFSPNVHRNNNTTVKNSNIRKFTKYSSISNYSTNDAVPCSKNVVPCITQTWPLAGKRYPGFKPLGYRTRPTFGEQCLKTRNQWPSPPEEPGPTLPYLDLFADDPTGDKFSEPVKNEPKAKQGKLVSCIRKSRFPALFDSNNIRNGLFRFDKQSHIKEGKTDAAISSSADFPVVASCKLNMMVNQQRDKNENFDEVSDENCSECPLCRKEFERQDVRKSNYPNYHIHLPSTD